ncbi:MAG: hypothetical protein A3G02_02845 [Candidatus Yanofskybacteria bacterium RIFCSPLOWO2_12_FULL_44_13b]|uniref:Uncharacterized protein n=2 Tax=Patescibacteria group TaxID=1783273 RepID=A0A0G1GMM5_9BACT|nr:MAG: hypothetical protein UV63_C0037G0002 [Microgenomates group bacterium GW2011_GWC1_43_11]KKT35785.1 MAG: hypothetical protein UW22_C0048G0002 [Candidatus Gottesmanbacteria bacterium GW2011_GWB1_44_11c]OGN03623.1 MAG: hypothetical protein A2657_00240 [Candidatus Yanofskybacteria bacterium RIFCSPHIGHO2_01_FULL_44_110b]OGN18828.1 MAG: hypothetical protein A3F50_00165 [Candidatus Yanofskybacteria bacterium RIFCSPHIGHO2_12_FULL_44_29b]OGN25664.1 MAG: hypothetical protein A3B12_00670 [Candidatu
MDANFIQNFPFGLVLLALLVLVYWIQAFFIIYHLIRFGIGPKPKIFSLIFFVGSALLFMLVAGLYVNADLSLGSISKIFPDLINY